MRILLTGAKGQLATDLARYLAGDEVIGRSHEELEISDAAGVEAAVEQARPDIIINTAAFNRVDDCEEEPEKAFAVNLVGVYNLARAAARRGALLVHFSTDYVFDGAKRTPYVETDPPRPLSLYGMSKLAGEWVVQQYCKNYLLVRTCGLYGLAGSRSKGGNFVERILGLAATGRSIRVVNDQVLTPTSTRDLAEKLVPLIRSGQRGLFHMTNTGQCSWYEFAREIFRLAGVAADLGPTTSEAFGAKARRPPYSVLGNQGLRAAGFTDFRPWQDALADYLRERLECGLNGALAR